MKLTKKQAQKICQGYNLGGLESFKLIKGGLCNYNFILSTNKGKFIARILGRKLDDWKMDKIKMEFKVLNFLRKNKFPYETPKPLKNKDKKFISKIGEKGFWVYEMIPGESLEKTDKNKIKEISKALAIYHKTIKKLGKKFNEEKNSRNWVYEGFSKIEKSKIKNKVNTLAKKNVKFLKKILDKISENKFEENILINHRDFGINNVLFLGNKLTGIIDFDNLEMRPRINDVATGIKYICLERGKFDKEKMNLFLKTYEKYNKLTKKEKEMIPYQILQDSCTAFRWMYDEMKKNSNQRYSHLQYKLKEIAEIIKSFNLKF